MKKIWFSLLPVLLLAITASAQQKDAAPGNLRTVYLDKHGVIRWDNHEEVALFGANYCLPSACDYRAAGYVSGDRKEMITQDMAHFARMGWDGLRVCLWGDFENSDRHGNLVENDHLDLMDYLIYKAKERNIGILFTPITTYSSQWPDALHDTVSARGFSSYFKKSELGTHPEAIRVQVNYLQQILNHVNPYTGMAIKDEPSILFIEMINEPWHHSSDFKGSVLYINTLVNAVRSTGCKKLLFHNVSQDMKMAPVIRASKANGVSFAWYPMGLVSGHRLQGNHLRAVDDFTPLQTPELDGIPRIVYEFDEADSYTPFMYPAMARAFRSAGAQFAAMFSYDMLATAPYNLGWQTHLMNMVYYPQKAVASIIAAEIMKQVPRYQKFDNYPGNTSFGPFRISYGENLSEMVSTGKMLYAGSTSTLPPDANSLEKIVGYGSSPVVQYPGKGIYFLDKLSDGLWRLEVYPDALLVADPFEQPAADKPVCRLIYREWPMNINLPDLGKSFAVTAVNDGNTWSARSENGEFRIKPGVYVLSAVERPDRGSWPERIGNTGFTEFICPGPSAMPARVMISSGPEFTAGRSVMIRAEIIDSIPPREVSLYYRSVTFRNGYHKVPMTETEPYAYEAVIPAGDVKEGYYQYCIVTTSHRNRITYPVMTGKHPGDWDFSRAGLWQFSVVHEKAPLLLFNPISDAAYFAFTRIGDGGRQGIYDLIPGADGGQASVRLYFPVITDRSLNDYTLSLNVQSKILPRQELMPGATGISIRIRGDLKGQDAYLTLMESDGTSWVEKLTVQENWSSAFIPLEKFRPGKGVLLPLGFPERWNYWCTPAGGRGGPDDLIIPAAIERVQLSIRPSGTPLPNDNPWIDASSIYIHFD